MGIKMSSTIIHTSSKQFTRVTPSVDALVRLYNNDAEPLPTSASLFSIGIEKMS